MATLNKAAQELHGNVTVLVILLFMVAVIVFYAISITPQQREELLGYKVEAYTKNILDVKPGLLQGASEGDLEVNTHSFHTVAVDHTPKKTGRLLVSQLEVRQSVTSDTSGKYDFEVSKTSLDAAELTLEVIDKEGEGNLMIALNGQVVFDSPVPVGEKQEINLPLDLLSDDTNRVEIYVSSSGKFWKTNSYKISDLTLNIMEYTGENAVKIQTFVLSSDELDSLVEAKYQAFVKQSTENKANLKLELNEYELYSEIPDEETRLVIDVPKNYLKTSNTLRWSVERTGAYDVEFGKVVTTTAPAGNFKTYTFNVDSVAYKRITLGQYYCMLTISKESGPEVKVNLNGNAFRFILTEETMTKDVCGHLTAGTNSLIVSAGEDDVTLNQLTLTIKGK